MRRSDATDAIVGGVGCVAILAVSATALYFIQSEPTWVMVLPALACWLVGKVLAFAFACENTFFGKRLFEVAVLMLLIVVAMANVRGMYWSIFPQGEGFFTANRVSANILFIGLVFVATAANGRKARTFAGQSE